MAVYKRPDSKFYWTKFVVDGKQFQQSTRCKNKEAAKDFEASLRHQLNFKRIDLDLEKERPRILSFGEGCREFLASVAGQVKESTVRRYQTASKAPLAFFAKCSNVEDLDRKDIDDFLADRQKQTKKAPARLLTKKKNAKTTKPLKPATINRELALVRMVLNYVKPGHWQKIANPDRARKFKFPKEDVEPAWRVLEPREDRLYLFACSQPLRDVAELMLETGMRPEEVLSLTVKDVSFNHGYLQVVSGKTNAARRRIAISDRVRLILENRVAKSLNGLLFAGGRKGDADVPVIKLTNAHNAAVKRSGLTRFRLYDCRHTFATRAVQAGVDLVTLKDLLGHATLAMVTRYAHPTEQHRFDAIKKIGEYTATQRKAS